MKINLVFNKYIENYKEILFEIEKNLISKKVEFKNLSFFGARYGDALGLFHRGKINGRHYKDIYINFSMSPFEIYNKIRGFEPWAFCYIKAKNSFLRITERKENDSFCCKKAI